MKQRPAPTSNPGEFIVPKEGAFMLGISPGELRRRLRGPNPPPHRKYGKRYYLPRKEFTAWASRSVI